MGMSSAADMCSIVWYQALEIAQKRVLRGLEFRKFETNLKPHTLDI